LSDKWENNLLSVAMKVIKETRRSEISNEQKEVSEGHIRLSRAFMYCPTSIPAATTWNGSCCDLGRRCSAMTAGMVGQTLLAAE